MHEDTAEVRAFEFHGNWREFAPIAFTNLLLTIVTLGVYSFWARTRERQYLWSRTRFIDERLEWTGTGLELFLGYVLAAILFGLPLLVLQFGAQALAMRGETELLAIAVLVLYLLFFWLVGVAMFRALRYRLSRTYWHGIRGGSDDQGARYGLSYVWRTFVGWLAAGLMVPWAMTRLWNERWGAMSFGPHRFEAAAEWRPLMPRFLLFYLIPIVVVLGAGAAMLMGPGLGSGRSSEVPAALLIAALLGYFLYFVLLGLVALVFYAAYFREAVGGLSLGGLDFRFEARTWDWVRLMVGNFFLVVCTLGIGVIFVGYRNWRFFTRHMNAFGTVDLDTLTQSTTRAPRQGEGLLDAFDVGAF